MSDTRYLCRCCGEWHEGLAMSYGTEAPAYWHEEFAGDPTCRLEQEQCVIKAEHFFVRARLVIPVLDAEPGTEFDWGVWVSLSPANFERTLEVWTTPGRKSEPSYFGWLSTELPVYQPTTLNLKTRVHTQPVGRRPLVELEPTGCSVPLHDPGVLGRLWPAQNAGIMRESRRSTQPRPN